MAPCVKIINFSSSSSSDWIGEILLGDSFKGHDDGGGGEKRGECLLWKIETKYYTAQVELQFVDYQDDIKASEDMEAVIFNCDNTKQCLDTCERVWTKLSVYGPAVCLYVVPTATDTVTQGSGEASRTEILDWCLTNQFELVQCDDADHDDEDDDGFDEREGKERIVSALKAHTWSNLILAGDTPASQPNIPDNSDPNADDNVGSILESLSVDDGDDINFEDLFSQLTKMKEVSKNLPEHERKAYAEKVALAFYKSIGGSDSENDED